MPGDEEGNETPEQLRTYFTLNDNLKPVGVGRSYGYMDWTLMMRVLFETVTKAKRMTMIRMLIISLNPQLPHSSIPPLSTGVYFFHGGVLTSIENAKFWPILSRVYALFGVPLRT